MILAATLFNMEHLRLVPDTSWNSQAASITFHPDRNGQGKEASQLYASDIGGTFCPRMRIKSDWCYLAPVLKDFLVDSAFSRS